MFENLKNGWALGKATRQLVFKDKTLLLYPIIAVIVTIIEMIAIFALLIFGLVLAPAAVNAAANSGYTTIIGIILLLFLYIVIVFTSTYVTMAMFIAFRAAISGKRISIAASLGQTSQYWVQILEWSIFYGIILTLVRIAESRMRGIVRLLFASIVSVGLALATMFVVQIILDDKVGPIEAMKRSEQTLVHAFGKTFGGIIYSDLYGLMFVVVGVVLIIAGVFAAGASAIAGVALLVLGFILVLAGSVISGVLSSIFKLILYDYIKTGKFPQGFTKEMLDGSVKQKKQTGQQQQQAN